MSTTTTNLGLYKPELTDPADITKTNPNWDIIDIELKKALQGDLEVALPILKGGTGATTLNGAVANLLCRNAIGNDTIVDANTLIKTGIYKVYLTDETLAIHNNYPYVYGNMLVISNMEETSYAYIIQMFLTTNGIIYLRASTNTGSTWTTWAMLYGTNTTMPKPNPSDIGDGTFGGKVRANPTNTATVSDSQVRNINAGIIDLTAGSSALETGALYFVYE